MPRAAASRPAFTLVELLVAIAIIGTLIALLLPAVQAARESARRMQCLSNLRQVALAVTEYEDVHATLPAAGSFPPPSEALYYANSYMRLNMRTGSHHSWVTRLLPFIEQSSLYRQFDFNRHVAANEARPQLAQPSLLLCPSDEAEGRTYDYADQALGVSAPFAKANYVGFASPYHVDGYDNPGAIWLYGTPLKSVTDGLTNTLALSEVRTRDEPSDQRGVWALPWSGASLISFDMHPDVNRKKADDYAPPYHHNDASLGNTQLPNSKLPDVLYACPDLIGEQIDSMPCTTDGDKWRYISAAPRSSHPGGVNASYLDGSGHFLSDDIDEVAMAYMVAIDDGLSPEGN